MMSLRLGVTALCLLFAAPAVNAQPVANPATPNRAALEQRFREQSAKVAQQRLGLTDAQLAQLSQSNARFAPQQNQLVMQERETRRALRIEMTAGNQANQQHVSALLDDALRLQKQRIALVEAEQKDLARFLTPVQRAGYLALQAQVRRRAQELARDNSAEGQVLGKRQGAGALRRPAGKHLP
jgi:Spy/CpxP family protein refolding chaperone